MTARAVLTVAALLLLVGCARTPPGDARTPSPHVMGPPAPTASACPPVAPATRPALRPM